MVFPVKYENLPMKQKISSKVTTIQEKVALQSKLDQLPCWANDWQMKFNADKCKVLYIGSNNHHIQYLMNDTQLCR